MDRAGWRRRFRITLHALGVLAVVICGSAVGAALTPAVTTQVGPLQANLRVLPSLHPGVHLLLPPAGVVTFDTHDAPVAIEASISEVDLAGARALVQSPGGLARLQRTAPDDLRIATLEAAGVTALGAALGAGVLSLLVYRRRWMRTAQVMATLTAVLVSVTGVTAVTFNPDRFAQPHFTGLLSQAPYVAGQADSVIQRLQSYRAGLADILQGVTTLYGMSGDLPVLPGGASDNLVTVLHVSDIHLNPLGFDLIDRLVKQFKVDMVIDTGDITTWGTEVESATLSRVGQVGVPYVFVRGNHDSRRTQAAVAANHNAIVLDGGIAVVKGLVIAGIGDPRFTPDQGPSSQIPGQSPSATPASTSPPTSASSPAPAPSAGLTPGLAAGSVPASGTAGTPEPSPSSTASAAASAASASNASASPRPPVREDQPSADPEVRAGTRLADVVRTWNGQHSDEPVDIAAIHEPYGVPPLLGTVPLVLAGHFHKRSVEVDPSGTRVMIEGSTGGAGISADFKAIADGDPLPLSATLLYVARSGPRAGQVLAYDEVTVGGFGLASVSLERTVVREDAATAPHAGASPSPAPSPAPSPSSSGNALPSDVPGPPAAAAAGSRTSGRPTSTPQPARTTVPTGLATWPP